MTFWHLEEKCKCSGADLVRSGPDYSPGCQQEHQGPGILAGDVFLPRHAFTSGDRQHLELGAASQGRAQRGRGWHP